MNKILLAALASIGMLMACEPKKDKTAETPVKDSVDSAPVSLTLKWETDTVLTTCESVLYDNVRDVIYVANINGQPDQKDKNGFISKVGLDGKVQEAQWIKGLNAPKGLGLFGDKLYVADIDRVIEIDIPKSKIVKTHAVQGAKFLNDITVDSTGRVFITDMETGKILVIENGMLSTWMENIESPNGILADNGNMLLLLWGAKSVNTIDQTSKKLSAQTQGIENPDGIEAVGNGGYLVSSWNGMLTYVDDKWKNYTVLDSRADSIQSADIDYVQDKKLLLVPTFFHNTVRAYEVTVNK